MLVDGRAVDHPADRDELLTGGVRARADAGHQQGALRHLTARAAAAHEARPQHEHQGPDDQQQHREFPHGAMEDCSHERDAVRADWRWRWNSRSGPTPSTLDRFGALDLRIDTKPDLTPVTDADEAVEAQLRADSRRAATRRRGSRRGVRRDGRVPWQAVGDRPDRRHQELRPGGAGRASLIALLDDGVPVVGVVSAPRSTGAGGPGRDRRERRRW